MNLRSLFRRRPSAPLVISMVALVMSLGGVGYAAVLLPANSVGSAQIRDEAVTFTKINPNSVGAVRLANGGVINSKLANDSVSFKKIQAGAVGRVRANLNQLQARVGSTCSATNQAITAISGSGTVTCASAPPQEFGVSTTAPAAVTSGTTPTSVVTKSLPGGSSYVAFATPFVQVSNGDSDQQVNVSCTLSVGPATTATQTRSVSIPFTAAARDQAVSIPMAVTAPSSTGAITGSVSCTRTVAGGTTTPTVNVSATFNALQTQSNN